MMSLPATTTNSFRLGTILLALAGALLAGCANQAMPAAISSWQGRPVTEVTAAWGRPSEDIQLSGRRLLLWHNLAGELTGPGSAKPDPAVTTNYCTRLLTADRQGIVTSGSWEGDNCPGWLSGWHR